MVAISHRDGSISQSVSANASFFLDRLLAVTASWEARSRKITVGSAMAMGPPAGWFEANISLISQQINVRYSFW